MNTAKLIKQDVRIADGHLNVGPEIRARSGMGEKYPMTVGVIWGELVNCEHDLNTLDDMYHGVSNSDMLKPQVQFDIQMKVERVQLRQEVMIAAARVSIIDGFQALLAAKAPKEES